MDVKKTIREWMLPIAMVTGASIYLIYYIMPEPVHRAGPFLSGVVSILQPLLIFSMLFLTFCRIEPKDLKPHRWHWWLLLIQGGLFAVLGLLAVWVVNAFPGTYHDKVVLIESAMLCLICPTATAAAVVTGKLGGDVAGITTYTVLINLVAAVLVPLVVPLLHPMDGMDFWMAFSMIVAKIFPLLILPCLAAWLVRYLAPRIHRKLLNFPDLAFYLWAIALTFAITVTTKSIVHSTMSLRLLMLMGLISLVCCAFQFAMGRFIGSRYRPRTYSPIVEERGKEIRKVTSGQALGQKNTVFAIWMGYTFMTPETAIVGGLYSIWHNLYNSRQLRNAGKSNNKRN
ncbi:MAG: bile acid:sodium symporter [Bacteroidales bacterium]|nr:bile acid:sodium symporter [Bacteroidales bacterium]